jgi:hypothetical protein
LRFKRTLISMFRLPMALLLSDTVDLHKAHGSDTAQAAQQKTNDEKQKFHENLRPFQRGFRGRSP